MENRQCLIGESSCLAGLNEKLRRSETEESRSLVFLTFLPSHLLIFCFFLRTQRLSLRERESQ